MLTGVNDACLHGKRVERVFSLIVFGLILWLYWSTWRLVLHPWLVESYQGEGASQDGRVGSIIFMTIYHLSCWMTIWSMIVVTNTSPGFVPDNYQAVASGIGGTDWCLKCEQARPARAHHCRYCRRCILRMDHHCPWIGNCVGYWNHGHFLRFLTYASLSCLLALTATSIRLFRGYFIYEDLSNYYRLDELNEIGLIVAIINAAFTLCILMMLLILTVYQWSNSLWNMTTIEHLEWEAANDRAIRHRLPEIVFPYRFESKVACLKVILGDRIWAWPLPLPSRWLLKGQGNGIFFAHRPESIQISLISFKFYRFCVCS